MAVMAQEAPPTDRDQYVGRSMKVFDVPGISVAIVRDGRSPSLAGMALRKMGEAAPVDENTMSASVRTRRLSRLPH